MPQPPSARNVLLQRVLRIGAWGLMLLIATMTVGPIELRPHVAPLGIERGGAFFILGLMLTCAYPRELWLCAGLVLASAAALEALQHLMPGRHGQWDDLAIKAMGGLAGIALARIILRLVKGMP
jgi:hypothetical protein